MSTQNIKSLDGSSYKAWISQNIFLSLEIFSMQCRKNIAVEDKKKKMNITNFINIYANIYTYMLCDKNDSK